LRNTNKRRQRRGGRLRKKLRGLRMLNSRKRRGRNRIRRRKR
jgi:hypothetical protein